MLFGVGVFVVLPGLLFECKLTQINFFGCGKGRAVVVPFSWTRLHYFIVTLPVSSNKIILFKINFPFNATTQFIYYIISLYSFEYIFHRELRYNYFTKRPLVKIFDHIDFFKKQY